MQEVEQRREQFPSRVCNAVQAPSPDFSPGFRMMVRLGCFWVRFWTDRHSRSYGWREEACPGAPEACQRRKSVAQNRLRKSRFR